MSTRFSSCSRTRQTRRRSSASWSRARARGYLRFRLLSTTSSSNTTCHQMTWTSFSLPTHDSVTHVLRTYQENDLAFPKSPAEAWFNIHLWGFLRLALSRRRSLEYRSGEVSSDASANRRIRDGRQHAGHKVDGLVVVSARSLEICYMEAAKKDGGSNTTKCLDDTKKLLKLMKDAHDMIREKATQDIRERLITFGLRISGPTVTIFTLRQRPGRFYQAIAEASVSFPSIWLDGDTCTIIAIISRTLMLRKAILAMATGSRPQ